MSSKNYREFPTALRELIAKPDLRRRFMSMNSGDHAAEELSIPNELVGELKGVLIQLDGQPFASSVAPIGESDAAQMHDRVMESMDSTREFLDTSFVQLRNAYRLSML